MLAVLAYSHDRAARALVDRWRAAGEEAGLLTCADLSRRGWIHHPGHPEAGRAVVDGRIVATAALRAVLVRMPVVGEGELLHVHEADRTYAAAEMQAFLLAWLTSLACPVINRPSASNLAGPSWHTSEWVRRARRLGIAARPMASTTSYAPDAAPPEPARRVAAGDRFVDVFGSRAFVLGGREPGPADEPLAAAALALARDAGVDMLRAYFDPAPGATVFIDAGQWIDLAADAVADAVTERCLGFVHARPGQPLPDAWPGRPFSTKVASA